MKPLISVIVPVYNIQDYVRKCLESLARQNYKELEIIMVDDGSTDKSGEICDEFAKKDERVRVIHKKNAGLSEARNDGIRKARGEIIALVDGDDYAESDFVGKMWEVMKNEDADIVVCGFNDVIPKSMNMSGKRAVKKLLIEQENIEMVAWNKLYKKKLFTENEIWYPKGEKHEDALTTYKLLASAERVSYLDKAMYHYVTRGDSIMGEVEVKARLGMREKAAREAVEYFKDDADLRQAGEIAVLTAKYAMLDASLRGEVGKKEGEEARKWILKNASKYKTNKYLTKKLKVYNFLNKNIGYKVFRKIRHE